MKALFLLTIVLVASSADAGFLTGLKNTLSSVGHAFASTGSTLLHELDNVGGALFDKVKDAGKTLVSQGLQALALNTMSALKGPSRRELGSIMEKLSQFEQEATSVIEKEVGNFKSLLSSAISSFQKVINTVKEDLSDSDKIVAMIEKVTGIHNGMADSLLKGFITKMNDVAAKFFTSHKRNTFTDAIQSIGAQLSSVVQPAIAGFKNMVNTTGSALKSAATNLISKVKSTVSELGQKLSVHGKTAIDALKAATTDIFQQTMANAQGTINKLQTLG